MKEKILQASNQKLRQKAQVVEKIDAGVKKIVKNMEQVLAENDSALALAAPQLGISKQIVVIKEYQDKEKGLSIPSLVLINPKIVEKSDQEIAEDEGCLSLQEPEIRGQVSRASQAKVSYQDLAGKERKLEAEGLLARIFQHEIDHLKGKLFVDRANPESIYRVTEGTEDGKEI